MAKIKTPSGWGPTTDDDGAHWLAAQGLAGELPDDWTVVCGLASEGGFLPAVIRDGGGRALHGPVSIQYEHRYAQLLALLRVAVPQLKPKA